MKVGIIGCGSIANYAHIPSYLNNPEAFVIGGGVSKAGEMLFDYVRLYYEKYSNAPGLATKFTLATLGNDAGIYGAAAQLLASEA